jgi:hypothetical protein
VRLGAGQLIQENDTEMLMQDEDDDRKMDIYMVKESGKFVINDLEMLEEEDRKKKLTGKRGRIAIAKDHEESDASSVGDN